MWRRLPQEQTSDSRRPASSVLQNHLCRRHCPIYREQPAPRCRSSVRRELERHGCSRSEWTTTADSDARHQAWQTSSSLSVAVKAQFFTVGQYDALEPDDFIAVGELITDAHEHIAGF